MNKINKRYPKIFFTAFSLLLLAGVMPSPAAAQLFGGDDEGGNVELNGDIVEYSVDGNVVTAQGNVVVVRNGTRLYCDFVELDRTNQVAEADGNVRLVTKSEELLADHLVYDFGNMTGNFNNAKLVSEPFYGASQRVSKVSDDLVIMTDGYITTSDFDKPEFRMVSKKIEMFPGEKMVARNVRLLIGNVPVLYIPKLTQNLKDKRSQFDIKPGYDNQWGAFVLTGWRYYFNENFKGTIHLDYRELLDFAWGIDLDYKTENYGEGIIRTYYTHERRIPVDHFYEERLLPTPERERYKIEFRHKWDIDDNTDSIMQYSLISDSEFLKDYFEDEYDEDANPDTFFLLNRRLTHGTLSFRTDVRVNRFESKVERLPELRYNLGNQELGESNIFYKTTTTYSKLTEKFASPTETRFDTQRIDSDNEFSYPMKVSFIEFKPFVGERTTYYSKTKEDTGIRGIFKSGASLSTKFYRIFETQTDAFGMNIDRLRHIITPSINYLYEHDPSITSDQLDQFDDVDSQQRDHVINLSLENKLQTKRNDETVDLLRLIVGTDFRLKEDPNGGSFNTINSEIDFKPTDWLTLYFDSSFDARKERLNTANFDLYINGQDDKWYLNVGKRFNRDADDQVTTEFKYKINKKWDFKVYDRIDVEHGILKEQEYSLIRDLHAWIMEIVFNQTRGQGSEIIVIFTLKAFPDLSIDAGTEFNRRKENRN